jgi:hypothetical protein
MAKQWPLPLRSGNNIQFFSYALLPANTNQAAEGTVGSPISESSTKINAQIGQYSDYINASDLALDVAINKMVAIKFSYIGEHPERAIPRKDFRIGRIRRD